MRKRLFSLLLAVALILGMLPVTALADTDLGAVRVIVENTTFTQAVAESNGLEWKDTYWSGVLVDTKVALTQDSTMMSCILDALDAAGKSYETSSSYISSINGLTEFDGGAESGWMGTLNDWFTDEGFASFTVANRKLCGGDEIRVMYSRTGYGADLGGDWDTAEEGWLAGLTASTGTLKPDFARETMEYTLTVDPDVAAVDLTAAAENKVDQVTVSAAGTEYRRGKDIPVTDGMEITVACGAKTYTVTVAQAPAQPPVEIETLPSAWPSFRGNAQNNGVTDARTPVSAEQTQLLWAQALSTGWSDAPSPMILVDGKLITLCGSTLKQVDTETGAVTASAEMAAATSWGTTPPTYGDGILFCPLNGGKIQAFSAKTLESLWVYTDEQGGQAQSSIAYDNGFVYVGFGYSGEYAFVCLDARTGEVQWRQLDASGYYWAGAVVAGDYVVVGNDSGTLVSRDKQTGELKGELDCSVCGKIRSTICYAEGKVWFTGYNARLCWAELNADGTLGQLNTVDCSAYGSNSTSTPVVYNGLVYLGVGGWSGSQSIVCVDSASKTVKWSVEEPAYPQCSVLLSTAYESTGYLYLYVTYNAKPGGVNVIKAKTDGSEATQETLYTPDEDAQNYCICSVIADENGTLYYKNDSCNVFALQPAAADAAAETVDFTVQAGGAFLCAPQFGVEVRGDLAEQYGYADSVADGVSALDVLVKAHELLYTDFAENSSDYLALNSSGFLTTVFGEETSNFSFTVNGEMPHDDELKDDAYAPGGQSYTGYAINQCAVAAGDALEFFLYQDSYCLDNYSWAEYQGSRTAVVTVRPDAAVSLTYKGYCIAYYGCVPMEALVNAGCVDAMEAAQLAWVSTDTGALTEIDGAVTDEAGKVTLTAPAAEGTYYLTAYMPAEEIANYATPLVLSLVKVVVDEDAPEPETPAASCDLTALSVADLDSNPNALTMTPAFSSEVTAYAVEPVNFQPYAKMAYVKATAASKSAVITASLNGVEKSVTSADSYWTAFNNLLPGQDNVLSVTVSNGDDSKVYTVTIPMKAQTVAVTGVSLDRETLTLAVGGSAALTATVAPDNATDKTVTWTTSNDQVATVDDGTVTAVAAGTATITAQAGEKTAVCEVTVEAASVVVTLSGLHSAQVNSLSLYTYTDGVKGTQDLLADVTPTDSAYEITLLPGDYWVDGYDASENCNGGLMITVSEAHNSFKIQRIYQIRATNSGWVEGTDYSIGVTVTDADGVEREIALGQADSWGTIYSSCLFVLGDTVKAVFTPLGDRAAGSAAATATKTPTTNDSLTASIPLVYSVTITAPAGSTISAGVFRNYYIYEFAESEVTTDENGVTAAFRMPQATSGYHFYRVQNPDGVTYWNFAKWTADATVNVTAEDLCIGSEAFTPQTIYRFDQNVYDMANLYLNANGKGYLDLDVGEDFELNVFRNWMAIESFMNAKVGLPDVHYTVIDVNGNPSDLLTITPDENNSCVATMTANRAGTAIVLVTYDAMTSAPAMGGSRFSAIWPECTGVIVVTVGADGSAIQTNMTMDRLDNATTTLDAEHDFLFYLGDDGASYTFTPEAGCTVTVNRSVVSDSMTFGGFTDRGVTVAADGAVTVSGLTTGRHIIRVEKNGLAAYQVVTARQVSYVLQDAEGNPLAADAEIKAGDSIKVQFSGLLNPAEKMSGAYNFNASVYYVGEEGSAFKSNPGSSFGAYDFSGNPARQNLTITIPKYWAEESYTLRGAIKMGGFATVAIGGHRGFTYARGSDPGFNADSVGMILSSLPEITLYLAQTDFLAAQFRFVDQNGNPVDRAGLTITMADSSSNPVWVQEDGSFQCLAETYHYTIAGQGIQYTTGSVEVTAEGANTFTISLQTTGEGAWDGTTTAEPQQDDTGVYLISNGAELAWFSAQQQQNTQDLSGRLVADIDLGGYPWNNTLSSANRATVLEGDGHTISNLNATRGLFGALGLNSQIRNLTIQGTLSGGGAVTGYARGAVLEACVSEVQIQSTGSNIGGIVGYASDTTIRNCVNRGTITGGTSGGGIIGSIMGGTTVTGCYNTGAVTGTSQVGGIFGSSGYAITVDSCYNTGAVTGTGMVGGVGGQLAGPSYGEGTAALTDCYNVGTVTGNSETGGLVGRFAAAKASVTRGYYLDTAAAEDPVAEALDETWMKNADLNAETFGPTCHGYPALLWQTDVTFHVQGALQSTVAATCTERGYTAYLCTKCEAVYRTGFTAALGHDFCDHTENIPDCSDCVYTAPGCETEGSIVHTCRRDGCDVTRTDILPATGHTPLESSIQTFPAYQIYTCAVCGETGLVEWNDPRLAHVTLTGDGISNVTMTDGNYPWIFNETTDRFESTNQEVNSSTSSTSLTVVLSAAGTVRFDYGVSSETNYDKLTISLGDETIVNGISGENTGSFERQLEAGTYTLTFSYAKDSTSKSGSDLGWVSGLTMETEAAAPTLDEIYQTTAQTLLETEVSTGSIGGEWLMFGLARALDQAPTEAQKTAYLAAVKAYIQSKINTAGQLNQNKSTDNSRIALALTALGYDPAEFEGHDLLKAFGSTAWATGQGNNGTAFALLALRAADYPTSNEQDLIDSLLDSQNTDGGWAITSGASNLDATAMIIQALAPDYENARVKAAVDQALAFLAEKMTGEGTVSDGVNDPSAETVAQILVALTELGRDPATDTQFTQDGKTLLDGLTAFYVKDQGFAHVQDGEFNQMATEQAFYALVACRRLAAGARSLYDMTVSRETKYTVTVAPVSNGQVTVEPELAPAGATVTITATPDIGYELKSLTAADASGVPVALTGSTFTMPAADVTVTAVFTETENPARDVEEAIAALTVAQADAKTQAALEQVEQAYSALTEAQKADVPNAARLAALRQTFDRLLAQAKEAAKDELQDWFGQLKESDYTKENWSKLRTLLNDGLEAVDRAENTDEIDSILSYVKRSAEAIAEGEQITVTFRLIGDTQHDRGVTDHEAYITWIPTTTYTMDPGATMYDVFIRAIADNGLRQQGASSNYVSSIQAPAVLGGYWLGEFDNGKNSGWMYTVNGIHPSVGLKDYTLKDGDRIIWHYVDDYTLEERSASSQYYYRWLEAEDISPEAYAKKQNQTDAAEFTDVSKNDWFYDDVQFVVENGLFNGTSNTTFSPNAAMNRAMLVTVLYRLEGEPKVTGSSDFTDVASNQWYTDAVIWATKHEIVNGYGNGKFGPTDSITREQMAAILYRYAQYKNYSVRAANSLTDYSDYTQISAYALKALKWANAEGLINGRTATTLAPQGTATRAEVAAILHRFVENVVKAG